MPSYTLNFVVTYILFLSITTKRNRRNSSMTSNRPYQKLEEWKSHIVLSVHQDAAETAAIDTLSQSSVFLIMN